MTRYPAVPTWDGQAKRKLESKSFALTYRRATRKHFDFKSECMELAKSLALEANGLPLYVCLSGGIDGEIVCRSFMDAGLSFIPVVFEYKKHIWEDLTHVLNFVKQHRLPLKRVVFDEVAFLKEEIFKWSDKYPISEPLVAFDMERMDRLDGAVVFGCGDIVLEPSIGGLVSYERGSLFQAQDYIADNRRVGCYHFFQGSAEIMLAFLNDPIIQKWIELQPVMSFENSRQFKSYMYKKIWPDITLRKKWTGYERFAELYLTTQKSLHQANPIEQDRYDVELETLLEQLVYLP